MHHLDRSVRYELEARLTHGCEEDWPLVQTALRVCELAAATHHLSLYETVHTTRARLLILHGLELCEWRRACDACDMHDIERLTGRPGTLLSLLWNIDIALGMVEMFHARDTDTLPPDAHRARDEAWDREHVQQAFDDCGVDYSCVPAEA